MLLSFSESLQLQMGRVRSTNVTSCPLWLNYCFCLSLHPLTVGGFKLWSERTSHSTADSGLAAVGGQCEVPHWQDAQSHSLTAALDERSSNKGRQAHKSVVTRERLLHETSSWSPCSERTFTIQMVLKICSSCSPPPFPGPCQRPVLAAVSQWSVESCKNCPVADQPRDTIVSIMAP